MNSEGVTRAYVAELWSEEARARDDLSAKAPGGIVEFYKLAKKFVDNAASVPEDAEDVLYYTLSVGHHTGVMDCFERTLCVSSDTYSKAAARMPREVRFKLEGIERFGEIEINKEHVALLLKGVRSVLTGNLEAGSVDTMAYELTPSEGVFLNAFAALLLKVRDEPSVYLMARRRS